MNDPTNWNTDEVGSFAFASPEEAKKAEAVMNRALRESYDNGRRNALEEAAKIAENWGNAPPNPNGRRAALAAVLRALKPQDSCDAAQSDE
jgi:hypothetical protein